jgi:hypothetical protein
LDKRRNDHLGWRYNQRLFQHWREILRATSSHANAHTDSNGHCDRYLYINGNAYGDSESDAMH